MKIIKDYMKDETLRHGLNELTRNTFGFDFEGWVTGGYFEGDYIPYSYEENGKVIANASANRMKFVQNGEERFYIQIGTVMTDEAYRKQGLASSLIKMIIEDYKDKCDGFYLFANLEALGFYEKVGFDQIKECMYILKKNLLSSLQGSETDFMNCSDLDASIKNKYMEYVRNGFCQSAFSQKNRFGLCMFYTAEMDNVFYSKELDTFIVLEEDDNSLTIQDIISNKDIKLADLIERIQPGFESLRLGFVPKKEESDLFDVQVYDGADDYRLFYMGDELTDIEADKLYFPELSHA